jgi:hypothetical protein
MPRPITVIKNCAVPKSGSVSKGFSLVVTRDYGNYGLCTTLRLELRDLTRNCGASSLIVPPVHGDVDAVGFATGSAAGLANSRDVGIPSSLK